MIFNIVMTVCMLVCTLIQLYITYVRYWKKPKVVIDKDKIICSFDSSGFGEKREVIAISLYNSNCFPYDVKSISFNNFNTKDSLLINEPGFINFVIDANSSVIKTLNKTTFDKLCETCGSITIAYGNNTSSVIKIK